MEQRFPIPHDLHEIGTAERVEAAMLIEAAERAAASAVFEEPPRNGSYYRHQADEVELTGDDDKANGTSLALQRISDGMDSSNTYCVSHEGGESLVELSDREDILDDKNARVVEAAIAAIGRGKVKGVHRRSVNKWLEKGPADNSSVLLNLALTRTNDGRLMPTTTIDMTLFRLHSDANGVIIQTRRIENDSNTGELRMGDMVESEVFMSPSADEGTANVPPAPIMIDDPFTETTTTDLQNKIYPPIPVDTCIDSETWHRLITQPLDPRDRLEY